MTISLSIVTIHKGNLSDLIRTVNSIYPRLNSNIEHIVIARISSKEIFRVQMHCSKSLLVINQDKSLYDAMNIGIQLSSGRYINFINSGDEIIDAIPMDCLVARKCYIFVPTLGICGNIFKGRLGVINHQNFFAPVDKTVKFDDEFGLFADSRWMQQMTEKHGLDHKDRYYAIFHYGGVSTQPTIRQAYQNLRIDHFFLARVNLLIKSLLNFLGLGMINQFILKKKYLI